MTEQEAIDRLQAALDRLEESVGRAERSTPLRRGILLFDFVGASVLGAQLGCLLDNPLTRLLASIVQGLVVGVIVICVLTRKGHR